MPFIHIIIALLICVILTACNDSKTKQHQTESKQPQTTISLSNQPTLPNKPSESNHHDLQIIGDLETEVNKNTALVAYYPSKIIHHYHWQQLSGSDVVLSAPHQPVIHFRPTQTGIYQFLLTVSTEDGLTMEKTITLNVKAKLTNQSHYELLQDRAIQGSRSFIMHLSENIDPTNIHLEIKNQYNSFGLIANLDKTTGKIYLKSANPKQTQLYQVLIKQQGQLLDTAYVLVEATKPAISPYFCDRNGSQCATTQMLGRHLIYQQENNPYTQVLQSCTFSNQLQRSKLCSINTLPPLGYKKDNINLEDIKNRLIVSEKWLGDRFIDFLSTMDNQNDFKQLLKPVTAIIISDNIKVPFYWALTGAIYLSPYDFYYNQTEYQSISEPYNYHRYIGNQTSTAFLWRYHYNSQNINLEKFSQRPLKHIYLTLAGLMYHELAHANDFYIHTQLHQLQAHKTMLNNLPSMNQLLSYRLYRQYPLISSQMQNLAKYTFERQNINPEILNMDASMISDIFTKDGASDLYNYVNEKEDLAMLFEEWMMKYRFNVDRDIGFFAKNQKNNSDLILKKAIRNRIFDEQVSKRAIFVATQLLPKETDNFQHFIQNKQPQSLPTW